MTDKRRENWIIMSSTMQEVSLNWVLNTLMYKEFRESGLWAWGGLGKLMEWLSSTKSLRWVKIEIAIKKER